MVKELRISGKQLGELALPDFCPRCFWIKLRLGFKLPFETWPGIFSSIDSYSKNLVHSWFDRHAGPPPWLAGLGAITGYRQPPHWSKFSIVERETNIRLTGSPDAVFARPDGSYLIADYKTAKLTANQDSRYPQYAVQLNAYALIGQQCGFNPVSGLALVYTEPRNDKAAASDDGHCCDDGFLMAFVAKIIEVPLNTGMLLPLLWSVRELGEAPTAPPKSDKCENCDRLDELLLAAPSGLAVPDRLGLA